jgi:hypothetical protein
MFVIKSVLKWVYTFFCSALYAFQVPQDVPSQSGLIETLCKIFLHLPTWSLIDSFFLGEFNICFSTITKSSIVRWQIVDTQLTQPTISWVFSVHLNTKIILMQAWFKFIFSYFSKAKFLEKNWQLPDYCALKLKLKTWFAFVSASHASSDIWLQKIFINKDPKVTLSSVNAS